MTSTKLAQEVIYFLQCIPYSLLLQELDIKNVRDLEDLIIEAIYAGKYILYLVSSIKTGFTYDIV